MLIIKFCQTLPQRVLSLLVLIGFYYKRDVKTDPVITNYSQWILFCQAQGLFLRGHFFQSSYLILRSIFQNGDFMFNVNPSPRHLGNVNIASKKIDFFVYKREKLVLPPSNLHRLNLYNHRPHPPNLIRISFMGFSRSFLLCLVWIQSRMLLI